MMNIIENILLKYQPTFHPVVPFTGAASEIVSIDLSVNNNQLTEAVFSNTATFTQFIERYLTDKQARYAIGGYAERRNIYQKSKLFAEGATIKTEPRRIHLGIDIWGARDTPVFAFMGGMVHSFAFNNTDGDYGATLVLLHQLDGAAFYTLYGHLALKDIQFLSAGQYVVVGQQIGHFGGPDENGNWPPHLHLQVIEDMELKEGDYPGVCTASEAERYLANCPDPDVILQMRKYI